MFPYKEYRPGQREISNTVAKAIANREALLVQAPTGLGKTAAIIEGILKANAKRILYVVRTRNEIAPVVRELSRFKTSYVFLYSAKRMCPLHNKGSWQADELNTEYYDDFWENCRMLREKGLCTYYNTVLDLDDNTVQEIVKEGGENPYKSVWLLQRNGLCPFYALKTLIGKTRFIVATYPYLLNEDIFNLTLEPLSYEDFIVVIDEAHSLIDFPSLLGKKIEASTIKRAMREVIKALGRNSSAAIALERLITRLKEFKVGASLTRADKRIFMEILGDPEDWLNISTEIRIMMIEEGMSENEVSFINISLSLYKLAKFYEYLSKDGIALYISVDSEPILHAMPIEPCKVLYNPLNKPISTILSSATLPPKDFATRILCLHKAIREIRINLDNTVFNNNVLDNAMTTTNKKYITIVVENLTSRYSLRGELTYKRYADLIKNIHELSKKAILVVYPSYEFMRKIVSILVTSKANLIIEEKGTSISEVLDELYSEKHSIINAVAGGKLVEGVEYLDEEGVSLLEAVIVAGVPYPQPNDMIEDLIDKFSEGEPTALNKSDLYNLIASIRTRQALGRAIRSDKDKAIFILADKRFYFKKLRELLDIEFNYICRSIEECKSYYLEARKLLGYM